VAATTIRNSLIFPEENDSMKLTYTKSLAFVFAALLVTAGTAVAGPLDDVVTARQACMKANGKSMGTFVPIMKGEAAFDAKAVADAIAASNAACAGWAGWWGAGMEKGETVASRAKPEIWTDAAGFAAAGEAYGKAMAGVAAATDEASFKAAFPALGAACQGCHEKFQAPKG
jgi:cytochrome c556